MQFDDEGREFETTVSDDPVPPEDDDAPQEYYDVEGGSVPYQFQGDYRIPIWIKHPVAGQFLDWLVVSHRLAVTIHEHSLISRAYAKLISST